MTDATPCAICQRREPRDGATVCHACLGHIDDNLHRIAELTRLAGGWLEARGGTQEPTSRPVAGSRPPLTVGALDAALGLAGGIVDTAARDKAIAAKQGAPGLGWMRPTADTTRDTLNQPDPVVLETLESWAKMTREDAGLSPWGIATEGHPVTVDSLVAFLRSWLAWISEQPQYPVEDLAREIRDLRWGLERLDPDRDKPGLRIPCPTDNPDNDGRSCGYRLAVNRDTFADDIHCPRCDTTWTGNRLLLVALNDPAVTVWAYPDLIAETFGVNANTLRTWAHRGYVTRLGTRYDVGMVFRRMHSVA